MPRHVVILGGGLTSLSSAFHLARRLPNTKISLLEQTARVGGWVRSTRVEIPNIKAAPLLEAGPRTLRPNSKSLLELINLLGLTNQLITIPKTSPAAQFRYLYIPPSHDSRLSGLQRIPSSLISLFSSPLRRILFPAIVQEVLKLNNRPSGIQDESVDSFLSRRFGPSFARIFGSALIHGIYAADSRKVSLRAAFGAMWETEERGWGSLVRGSFLPNKKEITSDYDIVKVAEIMQGVSVYSFKEGMQTLTDALEKKLATFSNVEILHQSAVSALNVKPDKSYEVTLSSGQTLTPSHIISAIPTPNLCALLSSLIPPHALEILKTNPTSSVHVVNLVFNGPPRNYHPAGFGYLIPRPPKGYPTSFEVDNTNESFGILGTVFDSCSLFAQDEPVLGRDAYESAEFTKLTVMIGGPYPLPPLPSTLSSSDVSSPSQGEQLPQYIRIVLKHLSTHLSHPLPPPLYWRISPNERCIPTLLPGHLQRVEQLGETLRERFGDTFEVIGAGIGGVSVGDCVEAGRRAGATWV